MRSFQRPPAIKLNGNATDYEGRTFGHLKILYPSGYDPERKNIPLWLAHCDCGNEVEVRSYQLGNGSANACGQCSAKSGMYVQPIQVPYQVDESEQTSLDLSRETDIPSDDELGELLEPATHYTEFVDGIADSATQPPTDLDHELNAIRVCCEAFDNLPDAAHDRVFRYIRNRFPEIN